VTRHLRKMKRARQVEAVKLVIASNSITVAHADALLKASPPDQRTDYKPPKPEEPKGNPLEQIVKFEREMTQVQEKYKDADKSYGSELLNLVVAKGYLTKLVDKRGGPVLARPQCAGDSRAVRFGHQHDQHGGGDGAAGARRDR
jgi:hypothetical protein